MFSETWLLEIPRRTMEVQQFFRTLSAISDFGLLTTSGRLLAKRVGDSNARLLFPGKATMSPSHLVAQLQVNLGR